MNISDRVFGADFEPNIKKKLESRQLLAGGAEPNESVGTTSEQFENVSPYGTSIGHHHSFNGEYDLGSRKPWARMWLAVSLYTIDRSDPENPQKSDSLDMKVYSVGNNVLNDYEKDFAL